MKQFLYLKNFLRIFYLCGYSFLIFNQNLLGDIPSLDHSEKQVIEDLVDYHHRYKKQSHLQENKGPSLELFKDYARLYYDQHDNPAIQRTHQAIAVSTLEVAMGKYGIREKKGPNYDSQVEWALDFLVYHNLSSGFEGKAGTEALKEALKNLGGLDYLFKPLHMQHVAWIFLWHIKADYDRKVKFSMFPPEVNFHTYLLSESTYETPDDDNLDQDLKEAFLGYFREKYKEEKDLDLFINKHQATYNRIRQNIDRLYHLFTSRQSDDLKALPASLEGSKVETIRFSNSKVDKLGAYLEATEKANLKISTIEWKNPINYDVPGNNNSCGLNANYGFLKTINKNWNAHQNQSRPECFNMVNHFDNPLIRYMAIQDIMRLVLLNPDTLEWKAKSNSVDFVLKEFQKNESFKEFPQALKTLSKERSKRYTAQEIDLAYNNIRKMIETLNNASLEEKKENHDEMNNTFKVVTNKAKESLQKISGNQAAYSPVPFDDLLAKLGCYLNFIAMKNPILMDSDYFKAVQVLIEKLTEDKRGYLDLHKNLKEKYFHYLYKSEKEDDQFKFFQSNNSLVEKAMNYYIAKSSAQIDESGAFNRLMALMTKWDVIMLQYDKPLIGVKSIYHSGPENGIKTDGRPCAEKRFFCPMIVGGSKTGGHFNRIEIGEFWIDGKKE